MRQTSNSYELSKAEDQLKQNEAEIGALKLQIDNLQAQMKARHRKHHDIKLRVGDLKAEAVELSTKQQTMKGAYQKFIHLNAESAEDRVMGANGDGELSNLRSLFGLHSYGDTDLPRKKLIGIISFAVQLGMETNREWASNWSTPPDGMSLSSWKKIAGRKVGEILCNNSVDKNQARTILFYLLQLSPVNSPNDEKKRISKRRRSVSQEIDSSEIDSSLARSISRSKKRRFSVEELAHAFGNGSRRMSFGDVMKSVDAGERRGSMGSNASESSDLDPAPGPKRNPDSDADSDEHSSQSEKDD